jgi:hypothetical protein
MLEARVSTPLPPRSRVPYKSSIAAHCRLEGELAAPRFERVLERIRMLGGTTGQAELLATSLSWRSPELEVIVSAQDGATDLRVHGSAVAPLPIAATLAMAAGWVVVVASVGWLGLVTALAVFPVCYGVARARRTSDQAMLEQLTHELEQAIRAELARLPAGAPGALRGAPS